MTRWLVLTLCLAIAIPGPLEARQERSKKVLREFQIHNPCPSTGRQYGSCPGWERDHIIPLCDGGADTVENLQWLTVEDHKDKTKQDVRMCRTGAKNDR